MDRRGLPRANPVRVSPAAQVSGARYGPRGYLHHGDGPAYRRGAGQASGHCVQRSGSKGIVNVFLFSLGDKLRLCRPGYPAYKRDLSLAVVREDLCCMARWHPPRVKRSAKHRGTKRGEYLRSSRRRGAPPWSRREEITMGMLRRVPQSPAVPALEAVLAADQLAGSHPAFVEFLCLTAWAEDSKPRT